ncbi:MAG TPA: hypothetical protein VF540_12020 [Segetibacter sp.]
MIKTKGLIRFIIVTGILRFGLPVVTLSRIVLHLFDYGFTFDYEQSLTTSNILLLLFSILITGIAFGLIGWFIAENSYRKSIR